MTSLSKEDEINQIKMEKPHVVILGAGASIATLPDGDTNGIELPVMNNLIEKLNLQSIVDEISFDSDNFEELYAHISQEKRFDPIRLSLEQKIYEYFNQIKLPDTPTIYDHLLLSLRKKDCIATFNWDPLLPLAYLRNKKFCDLPTVLFLHGNVKIGFCKKDGIVGFVNNRCPKCMDFLKPTKLLYPITEKNYDEDEFISNQWKLLYNWINQAFMITFFGYSAPVSDKKAIKLMKDAWGVIKQRNMEQTEIIDIKSESILKSTWNPFIYSHHYEIHKNFYGSWIANHPRRTGEAYLNQYMMGNFITDNPIPQDSDFKNLYNWLKKHRDVEKSSS